MYTHTHIYKTFTHIYIKHSHTHIHIHITDMHTPAFTHVKHFHTHIHIHITETHTRTHMYTHIQTQTQHSIIIRKHPTLDFRGEIRNVYSSWTIGIKRDCMPETWNCHDSGQRGIHVSCSMSLLGKSFTQGHM